MKAVVKRGASRQEHQKKEIHTITKTTNSTAKIMKTSCKLSWKYSFTVSNRRSSKIFTTYVWHTKKLINEQFNCIFCAKNKAMAHIMRLNNRIYCVVGIFIFGFKTYWKQVFDLMEIQTTQTFKQFLKGKIFKTRKNRSYYQQYDVKRLRAIQKQAIINLFLQ